MTFDRGSGGHGRADEVRAAVTALPSLEVAVRGRSAPFPRLEDVRIHPQTHRAAGVPPFEPGGTSLCLREAQTPVFEDIGERFIEGDRRRPTGVSSQEGGVAPQLRELDRAEQVGVLDEAHAGIGQAEEKACQLADAD